MERSDASAARIEGDGVRLVMSQMDDYLKAALVEGSPLRVTKSSITLGPCILIYGTGTEAERHVPALQAKVHVVNSTGAFLKLIASYEDECILLAPRYGCWTYRRVEMARFGEKLKQLLFDSRFIAHVGDIMH